MGNKLFSFQLPEELLKKLSEKAEQQSLSVAALIRLIVYDYLKNN